jgi:ubiquinone/menaquinone biosynthesis C-methylase UbiE
MPTILSTSFNIESILSISLLVILLLILANYIYTVALSKLTEEVIEQNPKNLEGFEDGSDGSNSWGKYKVLRDEEIYDDFYAKVYNKLTQMDKITTAEAGLIFYDWKNTMDPSKMKILDVGCGTGVVSAALKKLGASEIIGLDLSPSMIKRARGILESTTLTPTEKQDITFIHGNAYSPSAIEPQSVTHALLLYFTIYYFKDQDAIFRNLAHWVQPGGGLAIEVVDKHRFEAVPDSSNPWVGISPQRYKKERITKGTVVFDQFEYTSEFELYDPLAEFSETFIFKDGTPTRRQKHSLYMYDIKKIVANAENAGWEYDKSMELMPVGFPHAFILFFRRKDSGTALPIQNIQD